MKITTPRLSRPLTLVGIVLVILLITAIVLAYTQYTAQAPAGSSPTPGSTIQQGRITCLPPKGPGPHTTICAIGLQATTGQYYALKMNGHDPNYRFSQVGLSVKVTGSLDTATASDYDIAGTITVSDITEDATIR